MINDQTSFLSYAQAAGHDTTNVIDDCLLTHKAIHV